MFIDKKKKSLPQNSGFLAFFFHLTAAVLHSLIDLESFYLQDDPLLMQPGCGVLQRLRFGLLAALLISFSFHLYRPASIPVNNVLNK